MKRLAIVMLLLSAFMSLSVDLKAQSETKELIVVLNKNYTYEDPRWGSPVELKRGEAISVYDKAGASYEYWPYPAADVAIPKKVAHVPGTVKGERCLIVTTNGLRLLEKPSAQSPYYCYNADSGASVAHNQFVSDKARPATDDWGLQADWQPYTYPKGTRLPYKGKQGNFYKTEIDGQEFYISAKQCQLK